MSFISDFFDGVVDNLVPALIVGGLTLATGGAAALAWSRIAFTAVAGGLSRALAKDPESSLGGAADVTVSTRSPTASRRLVYGKRRIGGTIVYTHATDGGSQLHYIIALCEGPIEAIDEIYFNDEIAVQANGTVVSKYSGIVQVDKKLGTTSQTASALAVQETPDAGNGAWTNDHRLRGVAYIYVELAFDRDKFPQGVPNISAVVRGRNDITDPRDASVGYTTNPALVLKHYIEDPKYGLNATVDDAAVQTAADVCDEQVSLKSGGTENRYTLNGVVDSADEPLTILNDIANSMAGWVTFTGGKWRMQAGEHRTPEMELTEDHMLSELSVTTRASRRERFNSVRGIHVSAQNDYQPADFPAYKDAAAITEDNGETIWKDVEFPYTGTASMAQRLARIEVERMRREILVEGLFDLSALQLIAGDVVELTDAQFGWTQKQFEVVDLAPDFNESPGVSLALRETDSAVYDWSSADEQETAQAPETDFPDPFTVSAPTGVLVQSGTAQLFRKQDGTIVSRMEVTWDHATGAFVRGYQVQYRKTGASAWQNGGDIDDDNRVAWIWDAEEGAEYEVRVRTINELGVRSAWTTPVTHTVVGKTAPPADVQNLRAVQDGENVILGWQPVAEADVAGYELRFGRADRSNWDTANKLTQVERGTRSTNADVPPGPWRFFIKAVDTSGNYSTNAAMRDLTVGTDYEAISDVTHDPGWTTGTRSGFDINGDALEPNNRFVAWYMADAVDLGFDAEDVRVWAEVDAALSAVDNNENYGSINGAVENIDDYGAITASVAVSEDYGELLLGVALSDASVTYEIAHRNDADEWGGGEEIEVYGAITDAVTATEDYGEITAEATSRIDYDTLMQWIEWTKGEIDCRHIRQRVRMHGEDEQLKLLRGFRSVVDTKVRTERHQSQAIAVNGTTINFNRRFHNVPAAVALTESNDGRYPVRESIDASSIKLRVHDETGDVGGTVDLTVTGA